MGASCVGMASAWMPISSALTTAAADCHNKMTAPSPDGPAAKTALMPIWL